MKLNRDKLFMVTREAAANGAHLALNPIQDLPPHEQLASVAVLYYVLAHRNIIDGHELYALGEKLIRPQRDHKTANIQVEALQDFAGFAHPTTS